MRVTRQTSKKLTAEGKEGDGGDEDSSQRDDPFSDQLRACQLDTRDNMLSNSNDSWVKVSQVNGPSLKSDDPNDNGHKSPLVGSPVQITDHTEGRAETVICLPDEPNEKKDSNNGNGDSTVDTKVEIKPSSNNSGRKRGRHRGHKLKSGTKTACPNAPNSNFTYRAMAKEDHGKQIYGVEFNWTLKPGQPLIFATVGSNRVSIYECGKPITLPKSEYKASKPNHAADPPLKVLQVYEDPDPEEVFYTCAWTHDTQGSPLLAVAGYRGVIRILSVAEGNCARHFLGHGGAINYLLIHPRDYNLLLSASQDHTIRLWNIKTGHCVATFCGVEGHRDGVLHIDFDLTGSRFVSGGMDHSMKIWQLDEEEVKAAIQLSYTWQSKILHKGKIDVYKPFPTIRRNFPEYSTREIHSNYVDCVKWFGEFIISKASCENKIVCWKGGSAFQKWSDVIAKKTKQTTVICDWGVEDCDAWYVRFGCDFANVHLALGNEVGQVYVYELKKGGSNDFTPEILSHPKCKDVIRQVSWSRDGKVLICVCEDSTIWRWDYTGDLGGGAPM